MTQPYYSDERVTVIHADCLDALAAMPAASVHAIVTDPPYGLEFMGKEWDSFKTGRAAKYAAGGSLDIEGMAAQSGKGGAGPSYVNRPAKRCAICGKQAWSGSPCRCDEPEWVMDNSPLHAFQEWCEAWARECLRVLKPGGHLLAFGGTRTWHRLAVAVEDAGFEMRDSIAWLYGSGFPKSLDVSKAIDKRREEDRAPRVRVTSWVADECARLGWTRARLCEAFGVKNQPIQSWTERNPAHAVIPTWENWQRLKSLVGLGDDMDAEVWRLNGRKGSPGEAWDSREVTGQHEQGNPIGLYEYKHGEGNGRSANERRDTPATPDAERWQGWGTALKPAFEPVVVARKPLAGTVAANVLAHGTGALNIAACRVGSVIGLQRPERRGKGDVGSWAGSSQEPGRYGTPDGSGRWPANVVLDPTAAAELDRQSGTLTSGVLAAHHQRAPKDAGILGAYGSAEGERGYGDTGGASRFFPTFRYVAKAPTSERPRVNGIAHATVKPLDLMRWLVRLVTPPGGLVLDPFAGSGTTLEAAILEGFRCVGIEREADYLPLILHRIERAQVPLDLGGGAA